MDRITTLHKRSKRQVSRWQWDYRQVCTGLLLIFLAIIAFKVPGDPDMGWHLQNGLYTLAHGWPQHGDVFSWTMPSYLWVSHEWLTEVLMVGISWIGGLWGLGIFFALLVGFIFWLAARAGSQSLQNTALAAIVGVMAAWPIIGVRPQMMTLLGMAILLVLLFRWRATGNMRLIYYIPLLFLVWANVHAGFASGFLLVGVFVFAEVMRLIFLRRSQHLLEPLMGFRQLVTLGVVTFIGGGVATLVNPYGWQIYRELWQTLTQSDILNRIAEWIPVDFASRGSFNLAIAGAVLLILVFASGLKTDYTRLALAIVFFFVAIASWRHLPLFAIAALPFFSEQLDYWSRHSRGVLFHTGTSTLVLGALVVLGGWWHVWNNAALMSDPVAYAGANEYPYHALQFLQQQGVTGKMFNEYNWGGYIIWQDPDRPVFIDGRMAIWQRNNVRIFDEFTSILGNRRDVALGLLNKWKVDYVLIYRRRPLNDILALERGEWKMIYRDGLATVWQRSAPIS